MRTTRTPLALAFALSLGLAACSPASEEPVAAPEAVPDTTTAADSAEPADRDAQADPMDAVLAGDWRDPDNAARDAWRHPRETLAFFGVGPS
ncbi:MAG TPA: methyltransferase, partial [Arenimonas sp.]|nr:methyltransferase [Arenimonas sp.]